MYLCLKYSCLPSWLVWAHKPRMGSILEFLLHCCSIKQHSFRLCISVYVIEMQKMFGAVTKIESPLLFQPHKLHLKSSSTNSILFPHWGSHLGMLLELREAKQDHADQDTARRWPGSSQEYLFALYSQALVSGRSPSESSNFRNYAVKTICIMKASN